MVGPARRVTRGRDQESAVDKHPETKYAGWDRFSGIIHRKSGRRRWVNSRMARLLEGMVRRMERNGSTLGEGHEHMLLRLAVAVCDPPVRKRLQRWLPPEIAMTAFSVAMSREELARRLRVHPQTVTRLTSDLERAGLIRTERRRVPHSGRGQGRWTTIWHLDCLQREAEHQLSAN